MPTKRRVPKNALPSQLAILAELRKQTALLVEMDDREDRKQAAKHAKKETGVAELVAANRSAHLAVMTDSSAGPKARVDAAKALLKLLAQSDGLSQSPPPAPLNVPP